MRWLTEMGVFAKVVEAGGFSKAAAQLGLTRSAVSKHVNRLEAGLAVKLLHRTTRAMSLTDAGRAVYEQCAVLAHAADEAVAAAGRLVAEPRGRLRLSAATAFGHRHVVPLLPEFLARHPEVTVDLVLVDRVVDLADEGFDLVLRQTNRPPSTLAARKLADLRFALCAAPAYLARYGRPTRLEHLADHNCIRQGLNETADEWQFDGPRGPVAIQVSGNALVTGSEAVHAWLRAGLGLAVAPTFVVGEDIKAGRLQRLLPSYRPRGWASELYALYLPSRQGNPKVRAFIDFLVERIGKPPYWDA